MHHVEFIDPGCTCGDKTEPEDTAVETTTDDTPIVDECTETALGASRPQYRMDYAHGNSETLFSLAADNALTSEYTGQYGSL